MPALLIVLGLAAVVVFAATGHKKHVPQAKALPAAESQGTLSFELDHAMPEPVVHEVLTALVHENDASHLEALAHSLERKYPLAARELHAKAETVKAAAPAPAATLAASSAPVESAPPRPEVHAPPHAEPPARPTTAHELDAASILQAAMRALVEESDPVVLDGFAESIRGSYPTAATLLATRASALRSANAPGAAGAVAPMRGAPPSNGASPATAMTSPARTPETAA